MTHPVQALLKKNAILKRSRPIGLICELIVPVAFVLYLISSTRTTYDKVLGDGTAEVSSGNAVRVQSYGDYGTNSLAFGPHSWESDVRAVERSPFPGMQLDASLDLSPVSSDEVKEDFIHSFLGSMEFTGENAVRVTLPSESYFPRLILVALEAMYSRVHGQAKKDVDAVVYMSRKNDGNAETLLLAQCFMIMFVFMSSVSRLSTTIVEERQLRLREVMKIQGVKDWHFYLSWFLTYGFIYLVHALAMSGVCMTAFADFSFLVLSLATWLFLLAAAAVTLGVTSVFDSPRMGTMVASVVMLFLIILGVKFDTNKPPSHQIPAMFIPTFAFRHFTQGCGRLANTGETVGLSTIFQTVDQCFNPGLALFMLVVDVVLFNLLYLYLEKVVPHEFGQTLPWYFPFTPAYWLAGVEGKKEQAPQGAAVSAEDLVQEPFTAREEQLIADDAVADFQHMTKVFKTDGVKLRAVDDVSFTMFPSEILCLLGANSAGKTTLTSMLLGLIETTAGQGRVLGLDMEKEQSKIRKLTGYCPQQDVLWPEMTVIQHMQLYGSIRGLSSVQAREQALNALQDSTFQSKAHTKVKNLSGGMKRKLCAMIAFMGNTKFVILDEPTTGLDPFSRRAMWDLLKTIKAGRIVCLTTHFMDEAELLGDRIAIMALGRLRAYGSSLYLKQSFGGGYELRIARSASAGASDERILAAIQNTISSVEVESVTNTEISTRIPLEENSKLKDLFKEIDARKAELAIESYTIAGAKLEDVFLKIARSSVPETVRRANEAADSETEIVETPKVTGATLLLYQMAAIFRKRVHLSYRSVQVVLFGLLLPLGLVFFGAELPGLMDFWIMAPQHGLIKFKASRIAYVENPLCPNELKLVRDLNSHTLKQQVTGLPVSSTSEISTVMQQLAEQSYVDHEVQAVVTVVQCRTGTTRPVAGLLFVHQQKLSYKDFMAITYEFFDRVLRFKYGNVASVQPEIHRDRMPMKGLDMLYSLAAMLVIGIGISLYGPVVGLFVANERLRGVKFQQFVSGLRVETYWIGSLLVDSAIFAVLALAIYVYFLARDLSSLVDYGNFFAALFAFCLGSVSVTYLVSRFTPSPMSTFWISISLNMVPGMIGLLNGLYFVFTHKDSKDMAAEHRDNQLRDIDNWQRISFIFPSFHFFRSEQMVFMIKSLDKMVEADLDELLKKASNGGATSDQLADARAQLKPHMKHMAKLLEERLFHKEIHADIFWTAVLGLIFFLLAVLIDLYWFNWKNRRTMSEDKAPATAIEDEEAVPVLHNADGRNSSPLLEIANLRKRFGSLRAVNGVSFSCSAGEVFGLLGTNSAGKTTIVKMAVGELGPDQGDVFIDGLHVHSNLQSVRSSFGYCAQHDALFEDLTVREHLEFYAAVKGVPFSEMEREISAIVNVLGLSAFVNTRGGRLSGGNKRKLSLAMAAIGGPAVLFLDEPSSGMDPLSQRFMWGIIKRLADARRTIILTTHSMEEAEAVSDRVGIMMTGQFKCIGTLQEIKTTYGRGYEVLVQAAAPTVMHLQALTDSLAQSHGVQLDGEDAKISRSVCTAIANATSPALAKEFEAEFAGSADEISASVFVEWLAENQACEAVHNFLTSHLSDDSRLTKIESLGLVQKYLVTKISNLSSVFHSLEACKTDGLVAEYSLTQFSLEQIFNDFAREDETLRKVKDAASESDE